MTILLTGSHGFLGSHTKTALEAAGHTVWTYSRRTNTIGDTCLTNCDVIVNCAGETENPENMISANLTFATDLLRAARVFKKRLIHVGSIAEELDGNSVYQVTKRAATQVCLSFASTYNLDVCVVRPSTMYGPGDKEGVFLPTIWKKWVDKQVIPVWPVRRDWIHVRDVARGIVQLVNQSETAGGTFRLVSGENVWNSQIVAIFEEAIGEKLNVEVPAKQPHSWPIFYRWSEWKPLISLNEGIRDFVTHMQCKDQNWTGAEN